MADQGSKPDITQIALGTSKPSPRQTLHETLKQNPANPSLLPQSGSESTCLAQELLPWTPCSG